MVYSLSNLCTICLQTIVVLFTISRADLVLVDALVCMQMNNHCCASLPFLLCSFLFSLNRFRFYSVHIHRESNYCWPDKGQICSGCRRRSMIHPAVISQKLSKIDPQLLHGTLLGSWHRWFCCCMQILTQTLSFGDIQVLNKQKCIKY